MGPGLRVAADTREYWGGGVGFAPRAAFASLAGASGCASQQPRRFCVAAPPSLAGFMQKRKSQPQKGGWLLKVVLGGCAYWAFTVPS